VIAAGIGRNHGLIVHGSEPALAVEIREDDAAPVDIFRVGGIAFDANAHDDGGTLLDLSDFAEGDVVAEAGHQAGLKIERAQVACGEAWNEEEEHAADEQGAYG